MANRDPLRDVPASSDTLFIRGFSSRHAVDDIRNFFARDGGRSTVEFFREAADGILFIALRFESRSAAKEILNRYNNTEVLGDRISIHWYREMRRAYGGFGDPRFNRDQFSRFDFRDRGRGGSYRGRGGGNSNFPPRTWNSRSGRDEGREYGGRQARRRRSSSRSRSRTRSPRSGSPQSRSRSSSYDRRSHSKSASSDQQARQRHRSSSDGSSQRRKIKSLDGNERRSMSGSPSSNSENENEASPTAQQHSKKMKRKKHKAHTSNNAQSEGSEPEKGEMELCDSDGSENEHDSPHDLLDRSLAMQPSQSVDDGKPAVRAALRSMVQAAPPVKKSTGVKTLDTERPEANDGSGFTASDVGRKVAPVAAPESSGSELMKDSSLQWKKIKDDKQLYEDMFFEKDLAQADRTRKPLRATPNEDVLSEMSYPRSMKTGSGEREQSSPFDEQFFKVPVPFQPPAPVQAPKKRKSSENEQQAAAAPKVAATQPSQQQKKKSSYEGGCGLWLPPEKMALVHEKKSEIEKAYKQDCETFATVTKMLISKDPGLEERIQLSLRENLKEIGQRCIQELRDFIEKLRTEQQIEAK